MTDDSPEGHAKNARNQLQAMKYKKMHDTNITEADIEYALQEINKALDKI